MSSESYLDIYCFSSPQFVSPISRLLSPYASFNFHIPVPPSTCTLTEQNKHPTTVVP